MLSAAIEQPITSRRANRIATSVFFFIAGLSFASWASRIPNIKLHLHLSDGAFGGVLFSLPVGSMVSLPLSGFLVTRFGSKKIVLLASLIYPAILVSLGAAAAVWQLVIALFFFGVSANMFNISVNTQAVGVEVQYGRSIMASFHGLWSLAGFGGAAIGTLMVSLGVIPVYHFSIICSLIFVLVFIAYRHTLAKDIGATSGPLFAKPSGIILKLGLIACGGMVCEGTMFDWSGVYFQKVIAVPKELVTIGYTCFMAAMATGRFTGDYLITRFGVKRMLQASGVVIATGLLTAVIFPYLYSAALGFMLVGFGVSSIVPMVYGLAGKSKKIPAGVAIASVSSIGFIGFLMGPPLIGFVAQKVSLRLSFTIIAMLGLATSIMATVIKTETN